jgi:hypothetical protein
VVASQTDAAPDTKLPPLPPLSNVTAIVGDDSVSIAFDPFAGALDYRVYPLPQDSDVSVGQDGSVVIHDAIYRCAGDRESAPAIVDSSPSIQSDAINTQVDQEMVGGYLRTLASATIGYVYPQPGPNLVPVYALGASNANADTTCYFARWRASRAKTYTTSDTERQQLLADFARDDGIVFYVPAAADETTTQIYADVQGDGNPYRNVYYFPDGPEASAHAKKQPAFFALAGPAPGTLPLMRVYYANECGWSHDELALGQERFDRIYKQGDALPWWSLLWTGITEPTTLVVEALDHGCPFQGLPSAQSIASVAPHQAFMTIDDMRATSPTSEVFLNGQHGGGDAGAGPLPRAIARSFVTVAPNPHPTMDFLATFPPGATPEVFTPVTNGPPSQNCSADWRYQSPTFDAHFICMEGGPTPGSGLFAFGPVLGELWSTMADNGADTNGKFRLTARQKATLSASSFLHVTMEVDSYSTARRYPQILISDQDAPVQYNLPNGHTLVIQPRGDISGSIDWPVDFNLQICNQRPWDVNNQCPQYDLYHVTDASGTVLHLAPNDELGEHASTDHRVLYDVYASSRRVYLFLDGAPYACADLPDAGPPQPGPVTVTWGDVLYHSAVDHTFAFHAAHMQTETHRHFDNLGFSSGVSAPAWDETRLPCMAPITP